MIWSIFKRNEPSLEEMIGSACQRLEEVIGSSILHMPNSEGNIHRGRLRDFVIANAIFVHRERVRKGSTCFDIDKFIDIYIRARLSMMDHPGGGVLSESIEYSKKETERFMILINEWKNRMCISDSHNSLKDMNIELLKELLYIPETSDIEYGAEILTRDRMPLQGIVFLEEIVENLLNE